MSIEVIYSALSEKDQSEVMLFAVGKLTNRPMIFADDEKEVPKPEPDELPKAARHSTRAVTINHGGVTYKTLKQACAAYGISTAMVYNTKRVLLGSTEDAFRQVVKDRKLFIPDDPPPPVELTIGGESLRN